MSIKTIIDQKGQTLIEALVSLSIAVAVISAITVVVLSSLNNATFTRNQNLATQYAQDGIETVKRISLSGTSPNFNSLENGDYCLDDGTNSDGPLSCHDDQFNESPDCPFTVLTNPGEGRCGFNVGQSVKFSREVSLGHENAECSGQTKVVVRVKWSDNKCSDDSGPFCHQVELSSCFSGYNPSKSGTSPI